MATAIADERAAAEPGRLRRSPFRICAASRSAHPSHPSGGLAYLGKVKATRARGASATFKAIGARYSLLVTKGPGRSKAKVYVDGRYIKTIDTTGDTMRCRQLVEIKSFASAGSHTVRVVNFGTAGRTLLNVDGLVAAR